MRRLILALPLLLIASPALAQVRVVPDQPDNAATATRGVDVFVMNEGGETVTADLPTRLSVTGKDGSAITLYRVGDARVSVSPGGFVKWRYRNVDPAAIAAARDLPPVEGDGAAPVLADAAPPPQPAPSADDGADDAMPPPAAVASVPPPPPVPAPPPGEVAVATSSGNHAGFLDRFEPYEPIYGVFGTSGAGAKLQFSFAFRPFNGAGVLDRLRFAYTQTMLWAVDQPSGPFRATDYSPEIFYEMPLGESVTAAVGWRHTSNGGGVSNSVDMNRIYARAAFHLPLGDGWQAEIAPQAWVYVGNQGIAPDLDRYWGYTALGLSVGRADGLKLAGTLRGNPGTGKGAGELFISYPLARLGGGLGFYLFGQGFTGYGESLSDFDRRVTYGRLGIALTR